MKINQISYFSKNCSIQCTYRNLSLDNGETTNNSDDIANTFNKYFASTAQNRKNIT